MTAATDAKLKAIINEIEGRLVNDGGVPRNIRKGATDAIALLNDTSKDIDLRVSSAINILADISNDSNVPTESWSAIMKIISDMETLLKSLT